VAGLSWKVTAEVQFNSHKRNIKPYSSLYISLQLACTDFLVRVVHVLPLFLYPRSSSVTFCINFFMASGSQLFMCSLNFNPSGCNIHYSGSGPVIICGTHTSQFKLVGRIYPGSSLWEVYIPVQVSGTYISRFKLVGRIHPGLSLWEVYIPVQVSGTYISPFKLVGRIYPGSS